MSRGRQGRAEVSNSHQGRASAPVGGCSFVRRVRACLRFAVFACRPRCRIGASCACHTRLSSHSSSIGKDKSLSIRITARGIRRRRSRQPRSSMSRQSERGTPCGWAQLDIPTPESLHTERIRSLSPTHKGKAASIFSDEVGLRNNVPESRARPSRSLAPSSLDVASERESLLQLLGRFATSILSRRYPPGQKALSFMTRGASIAKRPCRAEPLRTGESGFGMLDKVILQRTCAALPGPPAARTSAELSCYGAERSRAWRSRSVGAWKVPRLPRPARTASRMYEGERCA